MAMYSRVPVIPLIKDYNVLTIKTKTFRVALTGGRFELFDPAYFKSQESFKDQNKQLP